VPQSETFTADFGARKHRDLEQFEVNVTLKSRVQRGDHAITDVANRWRATRLPTAFVRGQFVHDLPHERQNP
jgi:hypothetical protein